MKVEGLTTVGQASNQGAVPDNPIGGNETLSLKIESIEKIPRPLKDKMFTPLFGRLQKLP